MLSHHRSWRGAFLALVLATLASSSAADLFGVWRSADHGATWTKASDGFPAELRLHDLSLRGSTALAATDRGALVSTNGGLNWSLRPSQPADRVRALTQLGGRAFAGAQTSGVFYTDDQGQTWHSWSDGLGELNVRSLASEGSTIYAGTDSQGVFRRAREGDRWLPLGEGLPEQGQALDLAVRNGVVFAALYSKGLYQLELGSQQWKRLGDVRPLQFALGESSLVAGHNPGGIHWSEDDGKTWRMASGWTGLSPIWALRRAGPNLLAGTSPEGLKLSRDDGATWQRSVNGLPPGCAVIAIASDGEHTLVGLLHKSGVDFDSVISADF